MQERLITLISSHFQFAAQYPKQEAEKENAGSDQNRSVVGENAEGRSEIALLFAEENIWFSAAPIIVLFHLGVRDQIRDLLVYEKLLGCDRSLGIFKGSTSERLLSAQHAINNGQVLFEVAWRFCFEPGKDRERFLEVVEALGVTGV